MCYRYERAPHRLRSLADLSSPDHQMTARYGMSEPLWDQRRRLAHLSISKEHVALVGALDDFIRVEAVPDRVHLVRQPLVAPVGGRPL